MLTWKTHWGNEVETVRHTEGGGGRDDEGRAPQAAKIRRVVLLCELQEHAIYFGQMSPQMSS